MERGLRAPWLDVLKTVLSGFLGVRRRNAHETQSARIRPLHVIIVGIVAVVLFVLTLVGVVRLVTG